MEGNESETREIGVTEGTDSSRREESRGYSYYAIADGG